MSTDLDIYRSAAVLIRQHGEGAALEAAGRADAMLERGDVEGQAVWKRIPGGGEATAEPEATGGAAATLSTSGILKHSRARTRGRGIVFFCLS